MPKVPKELEKAILSLPVKDKDKMLLKLVAKSELLIQQLNFQLLEDESDLKEKREEIKSTILRVSNVQRYARLDDDGYARFEWANYQPCKSNKR